MKGYTDLEQSKKLTEILPIESADMYYHYNTSVVKNYYEDIPNLIQLDNHFAFFNDDIPCWNLAALLSILPSGYVIVKNYHNFYYVESRDHEKSTNIFNNPVDACYELILKLHEQKLL